MSGVVPAYDSTARHTAYAALILVIIIIIIIIIIAVFAFRNQDLAVGIIDRWTVFRSTTSSTSETFTAAPNSIYLGSTSIPPNFVLTVQPYAGIGTDVDTTNTTIFKVVNNSANPIFINSTTGGLQVPGNNTATFMWDSATTIRRIGTSPT